MKKERSCKECGKVFKTLKPDKFRCTECIQKETKRRYRDKLRNDRSSGVTKLTLVRRQLRESRIVYTEVPCAFCQTPVKVDENAKHREHCCSTTCQAELSLVRARIRQRKYMAKRRSNVT